MFIVRFFIIFLLCLGWFSATAHGIEFDGVIEPYMIVNVGSGVAGILQTVNVDRGNFVRKGEVLATLQFGVEKAAMELAQARAEMEASILSKRAQLDFLLRKNQQNEELYKKGAVAFSQKDEAQTNRILAEQALQEALENKRLADLELKRATEVFNRMTIRSPIQGVVVERLLSPGEYIETQSILKIAQIDPLNVEVIIPAALFLSIRVGEKAKVIPEAPIGGQYIAEVKIVDRVIDAASGTFGVRLELPNPNYKLPAGLKCKVIFPVK